MPYSTLTPGSSGPEVLELQELLTLLGYGGPGDGLGNPDGKYGPRTEKAVSKFQQAAGLAVDGIAGADTRQAIDEADRSELELRRGMVVRRAQSILARSGFDVPIDGTYGLSTEAAVKVLQAKHGLTVDGFLGLKTWQAVNSLVTPPTP
jgi:peptidoglycan hydrolase-like protein with peptidoglycan-binding domain